VVFLLMSYLKYYLENFVLSILYCHFFLSFPSSRSVFLARQYSPMVLNRKIQSLLKTPTFLIFKSMLINFFVLNEPFKIVCPQSKSNLPTNQSSSCTGKTICMGHTRNSFVISFIFCLIGLYCS